MHLTKPSKWKPSTVEMALVVVRLVLLTCLTVFAGLTAYYAHDIYRTIVNR